MADGGMAEYTVVPRNQVHMLPEEVPTELGALVEPMAVAYHAATLAQVNDQSRALIYGAGPIGIGIWFALRGMGLTEIDVVEPTATRRASIEALGARTLDPTTQDVPGLIAEQTGGNGVDAAFDAAGVQPAVESALNCVGEQRPLISVAIYDKPLSTPLINLVLRERRIQGTICYTGDDYRAVIDLMARGHYDTTGWVDTIPLTGVVEQGFEELRAGRRMKLLVDPSA
jgi:(R,R)-butanediol dehydrogenase/meso-butanediol dehydrogenase/diacetyl reductase